jgi:hypothetical protein
LIVAEKPKPKGHDETPSNITDHPFEPRDKWWSLCKVCGLAQAAHAATTIDSSEEMAKDHIERYGEIRHAIPERQVELMQKYSYLLDREEELVRLSAGGRSRIGYASDDGLEDDDD